jgi:hypothetical protein
MATAGVATTATPTSRPTVIASHRHCHSQRRGKRDYKFLHGNLPIVHVSTVPDGNSLRNSLPGRCAVGQRDIKE